MTLSTGIGQARSRYSSADITAAQQKLQSSGYYKGAIDGRYNHKTVRALTDFQVDNNLGETGRLNRKTCNKLGITCGVPSASAATTTPSTPK
jgi:peptidoglycan hydrolase-like protein with peptidoglycan-binding domain